MDTASLLKSYQEEYPERECQAFLSYLEKQSAKWPSSEDLELIKKAITLAMKTIAEQAS